MLKSLKQKYLDQFQKVNVYLHKQVEAGVCDADNVSALNQLAYTQLYGTSSDKVDEYTISDKKYKVIDGQRVEDDVCWVKFASTEEELAQYIELRREGFFKRLSGREANGDECELDSYDDDCQTIPLIMGKKGDDRAFAIARLIHGESLPTILNSGQANVIKAEIGQDNIYEKSRMYVSAVKFRESNMPRSYMVLDMSLLSSLLLGNPEGLDNSHMLMSGSSKQIIRGEDAGLNTLYKGGVFDIGAKGATESYNKKKPVILSLNQCFKDSAKPRLWERLSSFYHDVYVNIAEQNGELLVSRAGRIARIYDVHGILNNSFAGKTILKGSSRPIDFEGVSPEVDRVLARKIKVREDLLRFERF